MQKKNLLWDLTTECNLKCLHCYNSENNHKCSSNPHEYTTEFLTEIVEKISKLGFNHIHLLGGEPLLFKNLNSLLQIAVNYNIEVSINTNGLLLTDTMCENLLKNHVSQIVISLDGASANDNNFIRGDGVFEKVTENIRNLLYLKEKTFSNTIIALATVITQTNIKNIHKIVFLASQLGVDFLDISALYHHGNASKNIKLLSITAEEYYDAIKKIVAYSQKLNQKIQIDCKSIVLQSIYEDLGINVHIDSSYDSCQAGKTMLYMDSELNLFPCGPYAYKMPNGKLKTHLFSENICQKIEQFNIVSKNQKSIRKSKICHQCKNNSICVQCPICFSDSTNLCEYVFDT